MLFNRRITWFIGILLLLAILLTACQATPTSEEPALATSPPEEVEEVEEAEEAVKGGTLIIGRQSENRTYDPQKTGRLVASHPFWLLYDTLVAVDENMEIQPLLAESWEVSDDGKVYTFNLREGVTFHSGDPLTADAVKFTLDRWGDPDTASPTAVAVRDVESVNVIDDLTVEVRLSRPRSDFLIRVGIAYGGILNPNTVNALGEDYGTLEAGADGTGPFMYVEATRGDTLIMDRNPNYTWGPPIYENQGPAYLERVSFRMIPEGSTQVLELETGGIQMIHKPPLADAERLDAVSGIEVIDFAFGYTTPMQLNMENPILAEDAVRKAMAYGIDREEVAQSAYFGYAEPAFGPLSDSYPEFWEGVKDIEYPYDPDKAVEVLEEAGWEIGADGIREKNGVPLTVTIFFGPGYGGEEAFTIVQARLREVGIDLQLNVVEWASIYGEYSAGNHGIANMWMIYASPQELFEKFYMCESIPLPNASFYCNPEMDTLINKAAETLDPDERKAIYADIIRITVEDLPAIPLTWQLDVIALSENMKGFEPLPTFGAGFYKLLDTFVE